jgi:hypothetical protein
MVTTALKVIKYAPAAMVLISDMFIVQSLLESFFIFFLPK